MLKSIQSRDFGEKWFGQLQKEVVEASPNSLKDFQEAIDPDTMGSDGKEGIDGADS